MAEYVYQEFPKWKYHPSKEPVMVDNAEQEAGLGHDWFDTVNQAKEALEKVKEALAKKKVAAI